MSYFDRRDDGGLGCGRDCSCDACRSATRRLGETYETDDDDDDEAPPLPSRASAAQVAGFGESPVATAPRAGIALKPTDAMARLIEAVRRGGAQLAMQELLRDGVRDENRMTDLLFFARHPERQGRRIASGETAAAQEWRTIRERWVRPRLRDARGPARPRPSAPARPVPRTTPPPRPRTAGPCPIEDPLPQLRHPTGTPCGAAGRKCWPANGKSLDIADADLPCTKDRNPTAYRAVLRYLNVADSANLRYARTPTSTFCNIFAHDATRLLGVSIPHWVRDDRQRSSRPIGWNEINANATFDWLARAGPAAGWLPIDAALITAVQRLAASRGAGGMIPAAAGRVLDPVLARLPRALAGAAVRIARAAHPDPSLLAQDSYLAQQFANLGFPTVVSWKNPTGSAGHIAMVAPESPGSLAARHASGMVLPRTTQAGARNFEDGIDGWIAGTRTRGRRFFIHA
jgi:hypothetical protein